MNTQTIMLDADLFTRLRAAAERQGVEPDDYAAARLTEALEAEAVDLADAVEGIREGLEDVRVGRVTPLEQVIAEARERRRLRQGAATAIAASDLAG